MFESLVEQLPSLEHTQIVSLNLSHNYIENVPRSWSPPPRLQMLRFSHNYLTTESVVELCRVLPVSVTTLHLNCNHITACRSLKNVQFPNSLTYLDMSWNYLSSSLLADIILPPALTTFVARSCNITHAIQSVHLPRRLAVLDLSHNTISSASELRLPHSLRVLSLASNVMSEWKHVPSVLPLGLQQLVLHDNYFCVNASHAALVAKTIMDNNQHRCQQLIQCRVMIALCLLRPPHPLSNIPDLCKHIISYWTPN